MSVYTDIKCERVYQDVKWGGPERDDRHTPAYWQLYITERINQNAYNGVMYRRLMIEIAALAIAAVESHDRIEKRLPPNATDNRDPEKIT